MLLNELCQSLFSQMPVSFFSYFGFDTEQHKFWMCSSHPEIQKARLKVEHPMWGVMLDQGYYWYDSFGWENVNQFYRNQNIYNILTVVKRNQHICESFNFGTLGQQEGMINYFFNNLDGIDGFINEFHDKGQDMIKALIVEAKPMLDFFSDPLPNISSRQETINTPHLSQQFYDYKERKWVKLSDREREVLYLFAIQGHTSKEIGEKLNISAKTVENHLEKLRIKMDASTSKKLLMRAVELGMVKIQSYIQ